MEVADPKQGVFSTELVREERLGGVIRYRLSGKVAPEGTFVNVTVYNHIQILEEGHWRARPTDSSLERRVLDAVSQKLSPKK